MISIKTMQVNSPFPLQFSQVPRTTLIPLQTATKWSMINLKGKSTDIITQEKNFIFRVTSRKEWPIWPNGSGVWLVDLKGGDEKLFILLFCNVHTISTQILSSGYHSLSKHLCFVLTKKLCLIRVEICCQ